jgi:monoamine oxidase
MAAFLAFQKFKQLQVVIVDGGLGGLAAAVALRRVGHLG